MMWWLVFGILLLSAQAQVAAPARPRGADQREASGAEPPAKAGCACWTSVALPETALVVAAHDGVFWVAGANEMVARSDDAGRHWTVLHRHRGEMIFALQFPGGGEVLAYGSGHTRLVSRDDGATWKRDEHAPGLEAIRAVSDVSRYGYVGNHLAWTHDGGRHWVSQALESGAAKLPTPILALEARDTSHAAALAAAPPRPRLLLRRDVAPTVPQPGPEVVAATGDGGAHWELTQPPSAATWKSLWASANSYQLFGTTAGGQPRSAVSSDGVHWTVSPSSLPANFYDCTAQGCLLEQGWAEIAGSKTRLWQVPPDEQEPLTASWAVVGDTFCRVSASLRCRLGRTPWQRPRTALYVAPKDTDFSHFQPPQVTFDADPRVAELHYQDPGRVAFQVLLSADGSLREALVRSTPRAEYVPAALDAVRRWKFKPALRQGKPVPTEVLISIGFFLQAP